jgi:hypothetical protein
MQDNVQMMMLAHGYHQLLRLTTQESRLQSVRQHNSAQSSTKFVSDCVLRLILENSMTYVEFEPFIVTFCLRQSVQNKQEVIFCTSYDAT